MFSFPVETLKEESAEITVPKLSAFKQSAGDYAPSKAPVFYNPLMKTNRDIAVLALQVHQKAIGRNLNVSEPLSGCGVRGIRFAKEAEGIEQIFLNDIRLEAFNMIRHNVQTNGLTEKVIVSNEDANSFLNEFAAPQKRFDYVDIDPFGCPISYMDSAIRATRGGGLLALTATDMAPLCGVYPKVALRKYGGLSLKTEYCHEIAVRLLAGSLATAAAKHNVGIDIRFSHSTGHYIRVYAMVNHGAKKADETIGKMGYILHCFECFHRETLNGLVSTIISANRCSNCGAPLRIAGPLWLGKIAEREFCKSMLEEMARRRMESQEKLIRILSLIEAESEGSVTYYVIDKICDKLGIRVSSLKSVLANLKERGFDAFPTHFHSRGVRTNAPAKVIIEAVK